MANMDTSHALVLLQFHNFGHALLSFWVNELTKLRAVSDDSACVVFRSTIHVLYYKLLCKLRHEDSLYKARHTTRDTCRCDQAIFRGSPSQGLRMLRYNIFRPVCVSVRSVQILSNI